VYARSRTDMRFGIVRGVLSNHTPKGGKLSAKQDTTGLRNRIRDAAAQPCECGHRKGSHGKVKLSLEHTNTVLVEVPDCVSWECPCQLFRPRGY
jgi:hypothetical protein